MAQEPEQLSEKFVTRAYREGDRAFILATWLRGLYHGDSWFSKVPRDIFMQAYHAGLERLLSLPTTFIRLAVLEDEPDVVLGYAVFTAVDDSIVLHWVYTKKPFRQAGIARSLVPSGIAFVTHLTKDGARLLHTIPGARFNPWA